MYILHCIDPILCGQVGAAFVAVLPTSLHWDRQKNVATVTDPYMNITGCRAAIWYSEKTLECDSKLATNNLTFIVTKPCLGYWMCKHNLHAYLIPRSIQTALRSHLQRSRNESLVLWPTVHHMITMLIDTGCSHTTCCRIFVLIGFYMKKVKYNLKFYLIRNKRRTY